MGQSRLVVEKRRKAETDEAPAVLDLRAWLARVERLGELKQVRGANCDLELGAITEINNRQRGPCLLFDQIVGHPPGYRVVTGTTGSPARLAATLRFPTDLGTGALVQALRGKPQHWAAQAGSFPPHYVDAGPVLENVRRGNEVNLFDFPVPRWHDRDGGRYIGTGCVVVTRDPDSGWVNLGTYRMMLHDERTCGLHIAPGHHGRQQMERFFKRGQPCPVVVSIGHDPLLFLLAGLEIAPGLSEYEYAGAVLGEPVRVVRGQLTGLPMPASSELVLEGWCREGNLKEEGPFGEFHGYFTDNVGLRQVFEVERVYHRDDPILLGAPPARPPHDYSYSKAVMRSALLHEALEKSGIPGVVSCWADEVGGSRMLLVVSLRQQYQGHARQAGVIASQCHVGAYIGRYVVVVDEDIDPANLSDVLWAVATRSDPRRDIQILRHAWGSKADPLNITFEQKAPYNSRAIIDATRPYEYRDLFPPVAEVGADLERQIRQKWSALLGDCPGPER